jgi:hypothetical protein
MEYESEELEMVRGRRIYRYLGPITAGCKLRWDLGNLRLTRCLDQHVVSLWRGFAEALATVIL